MSLPGIELDSSGAAGGAPIFQGGEFTVEPASGTCSFTMPIPAARGKAGFCPAPALVYHSAGGNGPFGMGWALDLPVITRSGVPRYDDTDVFLHNGRELVRDGHRYRPRIETDFTLIKRSGQGWTTVSPDGVTTAFLPSQRDHDRVFSWVPSEVRDRFGNVATYEYNLDGVLRRIRYGGHFLLEFEYGERPDTYRTHQGGFEVFAALRCIQIAVLHDFPDEFADGPNPRLIRTLDLSYDDDPAGSHLISVTQTGYQWDDGYYRRESLTPIEFGYTTGRAGRIVHTIVERGHATWTDLSQDGPPGALIRQRGGLSFRRDSGNGPLGVLAPPATSQVDLDDVELRFRMEGETGPVLLADMSGDGLADLVRVRNGAIAYWPNLGHGRFGSKVEMTGAPLFDHPELFDPDRVRTADITGTGTADLLYLGADGVRYWLNQSGNSFGTVHRLTAVPDVDFRDAEIVDLLGTGPCLVWRWEQGLRRYVELRDHVPHLLGSIKSGSRVTTIEYAGGSVTQVLVTDDVSGTKMETRYRYHDGRSLVEQIDVRDGGEAVTTRRWFHVDDATLSGLPQRTEISAGGVTYLTTEHTYRVERVAPEVTRHHPLQTITTYDGGRVVHDLVLEVDEFNAVRRSAAVVYRGESLERATLTEYSFTHVTAESAYRLRVPVQTRTWELADLPHRRLGPDDLTVARKHLCDATRIEYADNGRVRQTFRLALTALPDGASPELLASGGYLQDRDGWWAPSDLLHYNAAGDPVRAESPFGNVSTVEYDAYGLLPVAFARSLTDPFDKLVTHARNDYRLMKPYEVLDPHGHGAQVDHDALGRVTARWTFGRDGEGDPDDLPGLLCEYGPNWTRTRIRERHGDAAGPVQEEYVYFDGVGRVALTKRRAGDRWIANGHTFSGTHEFEADIAPPIAEESAPKPKRRVIADVAGNPLRSWDAHGNVSEHEYDLLRRPVRTWQRRAAGDRILAEAVWYGEAHPNALPRNLLGRAVITLDGAGMSAAMQHDFKGNRLNGRRRLASRYTDAPDWTALAGASLQDVENAADRAGLLDTEVHPTRTEFDALNRPITTVLPDGTIVTTGYGEDGLLETFHVDPIGPPPGETYVRSVERDARGRRELVIYGNFLRARSTYDPDTQRLTRWELLRSGTLEVVQDLHFAYDEDGRLAKPSPEPLAETSGKVELPGGAIAYHTPSRKVVHQADGSVEEWVKLGELEIYRRFVDGAQAQRRSTLHLHDGDDRIVEIRLDDGEMTWPRP